MHFSIGPNGKCIERMQLLIDCLATTTKIAMLKLYFGQCGNFIKSLNEFVCIHFHLQLKSLYFQKRKQQQQQNPILIHLALHFI